jgi:hypothetical protein
MKKILTILMLVLSVSTFGQTSTWNGTTWNPQPPNNNRNAIIDGNYNELADFTCKSLTVNTGKSFTIRTGHWVNVGEYGDNTAGDFINNGTVIVQSSADFWIYAGKLINNSSAANFVIENGGGMIQYNSIMVNIGSITFKRNTKPVKLSDFTYWSSPVNNQSYNILPPAAIVSPEIFTYSNSSINYGWGNNLNPTNGTMIIGKGYIAAKRYANDTSPQVIHTMNFIGVPNNGNISVPLTSFIGNRPNVGYLDGSMYLTGNPYASALDMNTFLTTNGASAVYLWTHNTILSSSIPGSEIYNYTPDDYAIYNGTAGVAASSPIVDGTPNNTSVPTRYIGSGQGFFVKAPTLGSKTFNFNNSMRAYIPIATNTQFYKQEQDQPVEKNRIWLFLTNNFNITRYNAVGYVTGATNGFDHYYDASIGDGRVAAIYSILNDNDLAIQGRTLPFDVNDQIPLGYKLPEGGSFQIGLNDVDGLFTDVSQPIYIQDNLLGITHNLRNSNYSFSVDAAGTVENRFVLKFVNTVLSNPDFVLNNTVLYNKDNSVIIKTNENINDVSVYDMLGREIYKIQNVGANSLVINNLPQSVLIFKINVNGVTVTKKHLK